MATAGCAWPQTVQKFFRLGREVLVLVTVHRGKRRPSENHPVHALCRVLGCSHVLCNRSFA